MTDRINGLTVGEMRAKAEAVKCDFCHGEGVRFMPGDSLPMDCCHCDTSGLDPDTITLALLDALEDARAELDSHPDREKLIVDLRSEYKQALDDNHEFASMLKRERTRAESAKAKLEALEETLVDTEDYDGNPLVIKRSDPDMKNRLADYIAHKDMMTEIDSDGILCGAHNTLARSIRKLNDSHASVEEECNDLEDRVKELEGERAELLDLLGKAVIYMGEASCNGAKCRLPHCDCCYGEEEADKAHEEMLAVEKAINALTRNETPNE